MVSSRKTSSVFSHHRSYTGYHTYKNLCFDYSPMLSHYKNFSFRNSPTLFCYFHIQWFYYYLIPLLVKLRVWHQEVTMCTECIDLMLLGMTHSGLSIGLWNCQHTAVSQTTLCSQESGNISPGPHHQPVKMQAKLVNSIQRIKATVDVDVLMECHDRTTVRSGHGREDVENLK